MSDPGYPYNSDPQQPGSPAVAGESVPVAPPPAPINPEAAGQTPAAQSPAPGMDRRGHVKGGRVSAVWIGAILAAILLVLLLVFIAQNSRTVVIHFLGIKGNVSLGISILAAAIVGVLLVAIPGTARIIQLRRALKKTHSST